MHGALRAWIVARFTFEPQCCDSSGGVGLSCTIQVDLALNGYSKFKQVGKDCVHWGGFVMYVHTKTIIENVHKQLFVVKILWLKNIWLIKNLSSCVYEMNSTCISSFFSDVLFNIKIRFCRCMNPTITREYCVYNRKGYSWEGSLYIETRPTQQESPWWEPKITWLFPAFGLSNIALLRKQSIENDAFW